MRGATSMKTEPITRATRTVQSDGEAPTACIAARHTVPAEVACEGDQRGRAAEGHHRRDDVATEVHPTERDDGHPVAETTEDDPILDADQGEHAKLHQQGDADPARIGRGEPM